MKKLNYKLINILLVFLIMFLLYKLFPLFYMFFGVLKKVLGPFFISFIISYALYPIAVFFNKRFNKTLSYIFTILIVIFLFFILFYFSIPIIIKELNILGNDLLTILPRILSKNIPSVFSNLINNTLSIFSNNVYKVSLSFIKNSISFVINLSLIAIMSVSLLVNMDKIRSFLKRVIRNKDVYLLIQNIDSELFCYIKSIFSIMLIEIFEYTLLYFLIGHPYYYLLGILIGITTIIPYVGALFTNFIAFITAINVSSKLFIFTALISLFIPIIDNYLVDPKIMSKRVKVSFLEVIVSIVISSSLFGVTGLIVAVPLYIIVSNIVKYLYKTIYNKAK